MTSVNIALWLESVIGKLLKIREPPTSIAPPIELPLPIPSPISPPELHNISLIPTTEKYFSPQKDFSKPKLWKYYPNKSMDIWYGQNYQDYITPDDEIVKYLSDRIFFDTSTDWMLLKFVSSKETINFKYREADGRLCRESGQDYYSCYQDQPDFWMQPSYYIWNFFEGDCGDYALTIASIFELRNIPYMVVGGYKEDIRGVRDWWVEFKYDGEVWLGQVNLHNGMPDRIEKVRSDYKPLIMFNKSTAMKKYEKWY